MPRFKKKYIPFVAAAASYFYTPWEYLGFSSSDRGFFVSMKMSLFCPPNAQRNYYQVSPVSDKGYNLYPHQHYKIWFSAKNDTFLPDKNQKRLTEFRENNPNDIMTLIYSGQLLTFLAILKLYYFCYTFKIIPKNFDNAISNDPTEKFLISCAREEMVNHKCGGNLAAASDIVRLLNYTRGLGLYSDFDTKINTSRVSNVIPIEVPIVYNLIPGGAFNNDVLYIADFNSDEIKTIQEAVANKCKLAREEDKVLELLSDVPTNIKKKLSPHCFFSASQPSHPAKNPLFILRSQIAMAIKKDPTLRVAYVATVSNLTGPLVMHEALKEHQKSHSVNSYSFQYAAGHDVIVSDEKQDLSWVPTGKNILGQEYGRL